MKFEHNWEFDTEEEMNETFKGGNRKLHNLIVDTALANLKTRKKTIPVVSIYTKEDDMIYDIMIERLDMVETLEKNLKIRFLKLIFLKTQVFSCILALL